MGRVGKKFIIKKKIEIVNNKPRLVKENLNSSKRKKINVVPVVKKNNVVVEKLDKKKERLLKRAGPSYNAFRIGEQFLENYIKKTNNDYDIIICIGSFNRYEKVKRLIDQVYNQSTKYKFKLILYNDGSTDIKYKLLSEIFPDIDYIFNEKNNGRNGYYETITSLFEKASQYNSHTICQIDDDYIICDNFIDTIMDLFFNLKEKDNKYVSIYYHKTSKETNEKVDIYRVDGGVMFDYFFIKCLNFKVPRPNSSEHVNIISSGVWRYISKQIAGNKLLSHRTEYSLVRHDGNEDSKMHSSHRKQAPIYSHNFKDDIEK